VVVKASTVDWAPGLTDCCASCKNLFLRNPCHEGAVLRLGRLRHGCNRISTRSDSVLCASYQVPGSPRQPR